MGRRVRSARTEPVADDRFPGFTDVVELGSGPGAEFAAREVGTNRAVRLRRLAPTDPALADPAELERELSTLAVISAHPNVVTLYCSVRAPDGSTVLVLEPATGSLADRVAAGGALPPPAAVAVAVAVAGALETAHRAGVRHGAVSPDTVLFTRFGAPVLGGLGLTAAPVGYAGPDGHVPPEVLVGAPVTPATDVYGLAATLYHLLAGRPAFPRRAEESAAELTLRILRDPAPALDAARVPIGLGDVLLRALAKEAGQRPASAAALAAQLTAVEQAEGWPLTPLVVGAARTPPRRPAPRPRESARPRPVSLSGAGAGPSSGSRSPAPARPTSTTWG